MKKDLKNVVVPFTLVFCMVFVSSVFYYKQVSAQQLSVLNQNAYAQKELIAQQEMQLLLLSKSLEAQTVPHAQRTILAQSNPTKPKVQFTQPDTTTAVVTQTAPVPTAVSVPSVVPQKSSVTISQAQIIAKAQAQAQAQAKVNAAAFAQQIATAKKAVQATTQKKATVAQKSVVTKPSRVSRAS